MAVSDQGGLRLEGLLRHCQVDVNKLFRREYPLVNDDGLVFDLHALRVTMVSNLLEAGVSIDIIRDLVGRATWMMTWFYNGRRSAILNASVQKAMHMRSQAHDALASGNKAAIENTPALAEWAGVGNMEALERVGTVPGWRRGSRSGFHGVAGIAVGDDLRL
jgi:hypothetical protein